MDEPRISFFKALCDLRLDARMVVIKTVRERNLAPCCVPKERKFVQVGFTQIIGNRGGEIFCLEVPEVDFRMWRVTGAKCHSPLKCSNQGKNRDHSWQHR